MNASAAEPLSPTFTGFVQKSRDGLILFEACLRGRLHHLPRRPNDQEHSQLIKSGNIFIYEEEGSGIKRWTDGVAWSPCRILDGFLIYRELDKPFAPGEKRRTIKRKRSSTLGVDGLQRCHLNSQEIDEMPRRITSSESPANSEIKPGLPSSEQDNAERPLIGSLVDNYNFRANGLVKKTMSISFNDTKYHLVSYYKTDDVKHNKLAQPLQDTRFQDITIRPELYLNQKFGARIEEIEYYAVDEERNLYPGITHPTAVNGKPMSRGQYYSTREHLERYTRPQMMYSMAANGQNMSPAQYYPGGQYPGMYAPMAISNAGNAAMYSAMPGTQWAQQPPTSYAGHPSYTAASSYGGYYTSGSQSEAEPAESHASLQLSGYNNRYSASHAGECHGFYSSSDMMLQSPFQSPVQCGSSTFGSMSAHRMDGTWGRQ